MRVSVVMATFQGCKYVKAQLQSILAQDRLPDQIVICDDGSTDGTVEICESTAFMAGASHKVAIFRNDVNRGVNSTFEGAIKASTGDVILLSDQDDVWYPHKIRRVLDMFESNADALLVIHDLEYCDEALRPIGQTKIERYKVLGASLDNYVTGMATAIRRELLSAALPIPATKGNSHDSWLHWVANELKGRVILEEPLAAYRRHTDAFTALDTLNTPKRVRGPDNTRWVRPSYVRHRLRQWPETLEKARNVYSARLSWVRSRPPGSSGSESAKALSALVEQLDQRLGVLEDARLNRVRKLTRLATNGTYGVPPRLRLLLGDLFSSSPKRVK